MASPVYQHPWYWMCKHSFCLTCTWMNFPTACAISMSLNGRQCKYVSFFYFPVTVKQPWKETTHGLLDILCKYIVDKSIVFRTVYYIASAPSDVRCNTKIVYQRTTRVEPNSGFEYLTTHHITQTLLCLWRKWAWNVECSWELVGVAGIIKCQH